MRILRKDQDNLSLQADAFIGNFKLAKQARNAFLNAEGFTSFEISTCTGAVFIGFDPAQFKDTKNNQTAQRLFRAFFNDSINSMLLPKH